ncbi:MAG TPA: GxxExxY protein [bacterium]|jgi:GxxExxY protein
MRLNDVTEQMIGAAIDVHREVGRGLLGSTHEACLQFELVGRGLRVERQKKLARRTSGFRAVTWAC